MAHKMRNDQLNSTAQHSTAQLSLMPMHFLLCNLFSVLHLAVAESVKSVFECREVYDAAQTRYRGRCTAPLLIDKKQQRLVSNESSDIMRMLNSVSLPGCNDIDLYPEHLQAEIDEVNDLVYDKVWAILYSLPRVATGLA